MRLSLVLLVVLVALAVLSVVEAKKKKPGPCTVKECKKCNLTGKKCKTCNTGFKPAQKGKKCKPKLCFVNPCKNGGKCKETKSKEEKCVCPDGFTGKLCETKVGCNLAGCAECNAKGNKCLVCEDGYKGPNNKGECKEIIIPDCEVKNCIECAEGTGKRCAMDKCEEGYKRTRKGQCNECGVDHCFECNAGGGKCKVDECHEGYKRNRKGQCNLCGVPFCYECRKSGKKCLKTECWEGYRYFRGLCYEIPAKPCTPDPCKNGGTCDKNDGSCACKGRWIGMTCEETDPCQNGGTFDEDEEVCVCPEGFSGDKCEESDIDECADGTDDCGADADCTNTATGFTCACKSGFRGDGKTCTACPKDCAKCDANGVCEKCSDKYALNDQYKSCSPTCKDWGRDLVFIIDSSGSVCLDWRGVWNIPNDCNNWRMQLKFIADVVNNLDVGPGDHQIRVGAVDFASTAWTLFEPMTDKGAIVSKVQSTSYSKGGTNTYSGLAQANAMLGRDARPNAPNYVVMLTDGLHNINTHLTLSTANSVKSKARMMTVGISDGVNEPAADALMKGMCTAPWNENYFKAPDFNALMNIVKIVTKTICPEFV